MACILTQQQKEQIETLWEVNLASLTPDCFEGAIVEPLNLSEECAPAAQDYLFLELNLPML